MSSKGTSAPPETSSASCHAASSTKAARASYRARLCMRRSFALAPVAPPTRTRDCKHNLRTERLRGDRLRRLGPLDGLAVVAQPLATVDAHRLHDRDQRAALLGQRVLDPRRNLGEGLALDDALLLERAQPQREGAGRDPGERALELAEAAAALGQITDHEQRPLAADDVGGTADGTFGVRH